MEICYTVYPRPAGTKAQTREHWLISIAEGLRYADKSDDLTWVSRDRNQDWVTYLLRSQRTRVTAQLQGQGDQISATILQQGDVDPNNIFLPPGVPISTATFPMTSAGMRDAVDYICPALKRETVYSRGENLKTRLSLHPDLQATPPIFFGGVIESVQFDEKSAVPVKEHGELKNAILRVSNGGLNVLIRVGSIASTYHPDQYKAGSRGLASTYTGYEHERVYTFSRDSLAIYYQMDGQ